ncbi:hypothetical protein [Arthrobacter sp. 2MCAF14]|uniref:hypothetical protein n=1 Tax=Arthrobacter sp. 2MCAF14 TaxID=3232982 RepID=UPI003F91D834
MALSEPFPDKASAVAGIAAVRECAGMGLIADLCPHIPLHRPSAQTMPAARTTSPLSTAAQPSSRSGGALPPPDCHGHTGRTRTRHKPPSQPAHGRLNCNQAGPGRRRTGRRRPQASRIGTPRSGATTQTGNGSHAGPWSRAISFRSPCTRVRGRPRTR